MDEKFNFDRTKQIAFSDYQITKKSNMKNKLRLNASGFSIIYSTPPFCQYYVLVAQLKYKKICVINRYFVNLYMQGKKNFTPQLFVSVNLLDLIPEDNFYRKFLMDLDFIKNGIYRLQKLVFKHPSFKHFDC